MGRALIYARLSRSRSDERSASTERQEADCRRLAAELGHEVVGVEVDDDVSAFTGRRRPGYSRLLIAVDAGLVDVVLAWAPDRLHRSPAELEGFVDLVDRTGTEVATVQAGRVDLATPAGRMQARMLGLVARYESEHRSARTRSAHEQIAEEGRWKGGRRPYGYEPQPDGSMVVIEAEAEIIRETTRRVIAGERVGSVVAELQRRGIPTVAGGTWTSTTLRRILGSPTLIGRRMHRGVDVGPGQWPSILTADEHAQVDAILGQIARRGRTPRVALLAGGRLTCRQCDVAMSTARRTNGQRLYRCLGCWSQVAAEPLEQLVTSAVLARLSTIDISDPPSAGGVSDDGRRLEAQLEQLATDHGEGLITRAEWLAARTPVIARIDELRQHTRPRLDRAALVGLTGPDAAAHQWPSLSLDRRQAVVDVLAQGVSLGRAIRRGPGLDPGRVHIHWAA